MAKFAMGGSDTPRKGEVWLQIVWAVALINSLMPALRHGGTYTYQFAAALKNELVFCPQVQRPADLNIIVVTDLAVQRPLQEMFGDANSSGLK